MARLEIIGVPQSTYTRVVRMACEEKGVAYDFTVAPPHSPEVNAIHPFGRIPVMRHGKVTLCESAAIVGYIDRAFAGPNLIPEDPAAAAACWQWVSIINTVIDPVMVRTYLLNYIFPKGADGQPDRTAIDGALPAMRKQAEVLDKAVAKTGYLAGSDASFADFALMPILFYVRRLPEGGEIVKGAANLEAYFTRHAARPAFQNTAPPPPPQK
jgi:glutathione S-transferase